jgi:hypothetical protein
VVCGDDDITTLAGQLEEETSPSPQPCQRASKRASSLPVNREGDHKRVVYGAIHRAGQLEKITPVRP